ncbi:hypothetical protein [Microbacterium esteraromaticum]|uniref:hypothetical protein n=1 Tax=Microbacterium esteraromaticum TaxID=57043 RepID=UPI001C9501FE|nr:hypothetical protein [Microbacterium esteraromaticum]MBY6061733.1 hypothetical protein [Microbacterium esteraromaticum]
MSDNLEITSGGAIAIDSSMVREIGRGLGQVGRHLEDAADLARRARATIVQAPALAAAVGTGGIDACAQRLMTLAEQTRMHAHGTEMMADTFELVELRTRQSALSVHRPDEALALQGRIDQLIAGDPDIEKRADMLVAAWQQTRFDGTGDQPLDALLWHPGSGPMLGPLGAGTIGGTMLAVSQMIARHGQGLLPYGSKPTGEAPPVRVTPVSTGTTKPPTGVRDSLSRIPYDATGQVVVEKYTMENGETRFMAYMDGTRASTWWTEDPWDMGSNWDMWVDRDKAASQVALQKALEQAGAKPGDTVGLVGYSQGAGIASVTAMEGVYKVDVVITAGNPVEPSLGPDQTLVELRHQGDIVSNLAGGGSSGGTGSTGSFTAHADVRGVLPIAAHGFEAYLETAAQVDASGDPRVDDLNESFFEELGQAVEVETTEYLAERPDV